MSDNFIWLEPEHKAALIILRKRNGNDTGFYDAEYNLWEFEIDELVKAGYIIKNDYYKLTEKGWITSLGFSRNFPNWKYVPTNQLKESIKRITQELNTR